MPSLELDAITTEYCSDRGFPVEQAMQLTGLSKEEVERDYAFYEAEFQAWVNGHAWDENHLPMN